MPRFKPVYPSLNRAHPLANGLVGCWPMTSNSGRVLYDQALNNLDGWFLPALEDASWYPSEWGAAVNQSNSTSKALNLPNSPLLSGVGNKFTFLIAFYDRTIVNYGILARKSAGFNGYMFRRQAGKMMAQTWGENNNRVFYSLTPLVAQQWNIAGFTLNNNVFSFYLNGMYDGGNTNNRGQLGDQTLPVTIGGNMDGLIGGIWVWNRPLTQPEIALHYQEPWGILRPVQRILKPAATAAGMFLPQLLQSGEYGGY